MKMYSRENFKPMHFQVVPLFLENDNIDHLTTLFAGSSVDKVTLIVDKKSLDNV